MTSTGLLVQRSPGSVTQALAPDRPHCTERGQGVELMPAWNTMEGDTGFLRLPFAPTCNARSAAHPAGVIE